MNDEALDRLISMAPPPADPDTHPADDELAAFASRRLSEPELNEIEAHLAVCGGCRDLVLELASDVPSGVFRLVSGAFQSGRGRTAFIAAGAVMAVAAAVAVAVYTPAVSHTPPFELQGPLGGLAEVRGQEAPSQRFNARSPFELRVKPTATPVSPAVSCQLFVQKDDGALVRAPGSWQRSAQGVFRYRHSAGAIFREGPGTYGVVVVVGTALPSAQSYPSVDALDGHTKEGQRYRASLTFVEEGNL